MTRSRAALLILLVVLGLAVAGCGGSDDEGTSTDEATTEASEEAGGVETLRGTVGPGFDISMEGTDSVEAETYMLVVDDQSTEHNFHLTGPGVDVSTEVEFEGEKTFEIKLQPGEYRFQCDPHASQMNGSFTVG